MKIENESEFINADSKFNLQKISADEIEIADVDDIYDGPLNGSCHWQGKEYYFLCFDKLENDGVDDRWPRKYILFELTSGHKSVLEVLRSTFLKHQHNLMGKKEYENIYNNFPKQKIEKSQVVGWFEAGGKPSVFMKTYFSWHDKILPI